MKTITVIETLEELLKVAKTPNLGIPADEKHKPYIYFREPASLGISEDGKFIVLNAEGFQLAPKVSVEELVEVLMAEHHIKINFSNKINKPYTGHSRDHLINELNRRKIMYRGRRKSTDQELIDRLVEHDEELADFDDDH